MRGIINRGCYDLYDFDEEDKTPANLPGWRPFSGSVEWANFSELCPLPWQYVPNEELRSSPSWGYFNFYDGGGYVADLGYNSSTAQAVISDLIEYGWIDRQTRVVLLEFTIYNPNTGYLIISAYHFEILPTGYGYPFPKIDTLLLTSTETGFYEFYLICQFLFIMMAFVFFIVEMYKLYLAKWTYLRDVWNWVEILRIFLSVLVVVFYIIKSKLILKLAANVKENPFATVSFGEAVTWSHAETTALAIAAFFTTLKLLHVIRFNQQVSIMMSSFRVSKSLLLSYSVIFIIIFVSYAQMGKLAFGNHIHGYSSVYNALFSEVIVCLGGQMRFHELTGVHRFLGPLYGISFLALMSFIFMNFFVAILNNSFEDVKSKTDKQSKEFEMTDFILERVCEMLRINQRGKDAGHNDLVREDDIASTNSLDNFDFPLKQTSEDGGSKSNENSANQTPITKSPSQHSATKLELGESINPKSLKRTPETPEKVSSTELDLDSSLVQLFERIGVLAGDLAREDERLDVKLLYVISQLSLRNNREISCEGTSSTLYRIEESSPATTTLQDNIECNRSSESKNSSEDEIMNFIRRRSTRELPIHLKAGSFYHQLQNNRTGAK